MRWEECGPGVVWVWDECDIDMGWGWAEERGLLSGECHWRLACLIGSQLALPTLVIVVIDHICIVCILLYMP